MMLFCGNMQCLEICLSCTVLQELTILFWLQSRKLTSSRSKAARTDDNGSIDYDWIPKENLQPSERRVSPRRRTRASGSGSGGSGDESGR